MIGRVAEGVRARPARLRGNALCGKESAPIFIAFFAPARRPAVRAPHLAERPLP